MTDDYEYAGTRALVRLHALHLRAFCATWRRAVAAGVTLPETDDPAYASLPLLLRHVVGAAREYMVWCCEVLELPAPPLPPLPEVDALVEDLEPYVESLLVAWGPPLVAVDGRTIDRSVHDSRWGVPYCIDAMLEHAVMHPIRHSFQLDELMAAPG